MKHYLLITAFFLFMLSAAVSGQYNYPDLPADTTMFGQYMQRTMELLDSSTPEKRNTVRVMVYGQSLSEQSWSDSIEDYLRKKYPYANMDFRNRAVGGFSSQILWQTTKMDMLEFYPDLVIFHVFGHHKYYDTILQYTLENTAAEMAIWTDPHEGDWSDQMSYGYIPGYTEKYNLELMQIRDDWADYLDKHDLLRGDVTRDGTHLNDRGNFLLANLLKPYFERKRKWEDPDPYGRVVTYEVGKDIFWEDDTLRLPFAGNRLDVIALNDEVEAGQSAKVLIDGLLPSEIPGTYNHTRPNERPGGGWVWSNAAFLRLFRSVPWEEEHWVLTLDSISSDYAYCEYNVTGSLTGQEGTGNTRDDFISNSGKVIIHGGQAADDPYWGAWHIQRSNTVSGLTVSEGSTIEWDTYCMGMDQYVPVSTGDQAIENATTLVQGIANDHHLLMLVNEGSGEIPVKYIRIYRPTLKRSEATRMLSSDQEKVVLGAEEDASVDVEIISDTDWYVTGGETWFEVSKRSGEGDGNITLTTLSSHEEKNVRAGSIVIIGTGAEPLTLEIEQQTSYEPRAYASVDSLGFTHYMGMSGFSISTNAEWELILSDTWIHVDKYSGSADDTVTVGVEANDGAEARAGMIILEVEENNSDTVLVYQEGTGVGFENTTNRQADISIYPNPAGDFIFISAGNGLLHSIEIMDVAGAVIRRPKVEEQDVQELNIGTLAPGIYLLRLNVSGGFYTRMLIRQPG